MKHRRVKGKALLLLSLMASLTMPLRTEAQRASAPLTFDTVGAGRGIPPNPYATTPSARWLAGDTVVWTRVTDHTLEPPLIIQLEAWARDTNVGNAPAPRPIRFAVCPFELSIYDGPERLGKPRWQSTRASRAIACPPVETRPGGGSDWTASLRVGVLTRFLVPAILGDSLASGRYYFRYAVRLADGRRLEYSDGDAYLMRTPVRQTRDHSALHFTSGSAIAGEFPRSVNVWTVIRNVGPEGVIIARSGCPLRFGLWRTASRTGAPAWTSEIRTLMFEGGRSIRPAHYPCESSVQHSVLLPNDTLALRVSIPVAEITQDSTVSDGRYWVGVDVALVTDTLRPIESAVHQSFDAGAVSVSGVADKPPAVRQLGAIRIEAATRIVRGPSRDQDSLRVFVLMTNTTDRPQDVEVMRGNPLIVEGYRTAAERDLYPGRPGTYRMPQGTIGGFPHLFTLGANAKWLFERSAPVADVVGRVGPGRMYFLAWLVSPAWPTGLAAGQVELR